MAIREKLRARFSKNKTPSSEKSTTSDSNPNPEYYMGRTDIEYYKPNEIPKSKYRGRVDKNHQDKLDAFTFAETFQSFARRSSAAMSGTFSPGGTKSFSRRTSYASHAGAQTPARSRRSSLSSDANESFSVPNSESASTHMRSIPAALASNKTTSAADTDSRNTGLSKIVTAQDSRPQSRANVNVPMIRLDRELTVTEKISDLSRNHIEHSRRSDELPFTPEELTQAMSRATITPQTTKRRTSVAVA